MANLLLLETATAMCSAALCVDGRIISIYENDQGQNHARLLPSFMEQCLRDAGLKWNDLDAVAVSRGPGSYTGLRIGVAAAKGICYALDKPLIGVNTLQSMALVASQKTPQEPGTWYCPMIDARRMEVYTALFRDDCEPAGPITAQIIGPEFIEKLNPDHKTLFFGDGMAKGKSVLEMFAQARFLSDFSPSATGMVPLAQTAYRLGVFEDVTTFEPLYLKDFFTPRQPGTASKRQ